MTVSVYKKSLSAASLIVAIPAGFLGYLLVMAFLQSPGFDNMAGFFKIISGLTLTLLTITVLMPVLVLIFGPKAEAVDNPADQKSGQKPSDEVGDDAGVADDEFGADDAFAEDEGDAFEDDDDFGDDSFGDDDAFDDFDDDEFK